MKLAKYSLYCLLFLIAIQLSSCKSSKGTPQTANTKSTQLSADQKKLLSTARSYLGTKYKYGGTSKKGMDCSGLICTSYNEIGITLPRTSSDQSNYGKRIYIGELVPGDLVFFGHKPNSKKITHVGMVTEVKDGTITFIHASSSQGVVENDMTTGWWRDRYIKAVRPLEK